MTTPEDDLPAVDLTKADSPGGQAPVEAPFDPYRFGRPEHPVPPEFAPPGYVPDPPVASDPYAAPPNPYGPHHVAQPYPYGQQPTGYPPYQPYGYPGAYPGAGYPGGPDTGAGQGSNGKAITAMVLGIASIPMFFLTWLDLALIVPALVFGILGLGQARRRNGKGRSQAIAGLVCLVVGAIAATIFTVFIVHRAEHCQHYRDDGDNSGYSQCIRDGD